jgi:nucleoside-diphosphate-sugar epimerase
MGERRGEAEAPAGSRAMTIASTVSRDDVMLVTGANGFIGKRVVASLLEQGFRRIRCLTRPSSNASDLQALAAKYRPQADVEIVRGNLLSRADCVEASRDVAVAYHLALGGGGKSFPDSFMGAVVTTRNLIEALLDEGRLKRFVNISSFAVYTNRNKSRRQVLDESSEVEPNPESCGEAYCYAKARQDDLVVHYGEQRGLPWVTLRPGVVYGPGKRQLSGRIGLGTFGIFLHMGSSNRIPFTYVDNCADAIVLAGVTPGIEREIFNIVDDDVPTSRAFLKMYKRRVGPFRSISLPRPASYALCYLWERASARSQRQLPEFLNRRAWRAYWKGSRYSNRKLKERLGWTPRVSMGDGLERFFASCRTDSTHA